MRHGQRTFWLDTKEDLHTCSISATITHVMSWCFSFQEIVALCCRVVMKHLCYVTTGELIDDCFILCWVATAAHVDRVVKVRCGCHVVCRAVKAMWSGSGRGCVSLTFACASILNMLPVHTRSCLLSLSLLLVFHFFCAARLQDLLTSVVWCDA